ncbi:S-layer homology domain-containing protein [Paenibacillus sophorae]|uniref:S-layer homology domain-containing protein n=1 Tax=Paenibacillus sophorae TaxID=1333845 RepID=A0A1H8QDS0_9BACL|nr:S-layer homology domain-containing protein [Paenibacillus sophorae]QWU15174.1 S-layer homology domain-containing protein [Paenibacillus sophorae]SEO52034.1 S-layer homology domain-containing protein [Paenibacillus sophorae]
MKKKHIRTPGFTVKSALTGMVAFTLVMPAGLAAAASSSVTLVAQPVSLNAPAEKSQNAAASAKTADADPAKVKFTKEQAISKLKELFPILADAEVTNVELGITNSFPAPSNQMIWNIQWNYQKGNSGYGFSSQVDAVNGDLISTSLYFSDRQQNQSYYPPEITREQALEKAKAFISKAAPSLSINDLELQDGIDYMSNLALFGPVQYGFTFSVIKNGITSPLENVNMVVAADGSVRQFNKSPEHWNYPAVTASLSQAKAEQTFSDQFDVELVYMPVYKNGGGNSWILGWRPTERALYAIDALTGKRLNTSGAESTVTTSVYSDVPQATSRFTPRTAATEITSDEAAKLVKQVVSIPAARKLVSSSLGSDYTDTDRKIWRLNWTDNESLKTGYPSQSYAEVDAITGQILSFNENRYPVPPGAQEANKPKGKETNATRQQARNKAIALVNLLYPNAAGNLKLVEREDTAGEGAGFTFQFLRFYKGVPVSDGGLTLVLDHTGALKTYNVPRTTDLGKAGVDLSAVKVAKAEARAQTFDRYKVKLQYGSFGGFGGYGGYTVAGYNEPKIKLVYSPVLADPANVPEVIDAVTGKLTAQYEVPGQLKKAASASDIQGHAAEQALSTLVKYNILVPDQDGKVNPDSEITAGDWLTWISKAVTPYFGGYNNGTEPKPVAGVSPENPYYNAVSYAVQNQWIDPGSTFQADTKLTREGFAVLLTSIVKYNKISAFLQADPVLAQFGDAASITRKGEVAVAVKLGLLQGENGKFNPADTVTKAEAATVMMKLVELQGKTDQAIGQPIY